MLMAEVATGGSVAMNADEANDIGRAMAESMQPQQTQDSKLLSDREKQSLSPQAQSPANLAKLTGRRAPEGAEGASDGEGDLGAELLADMEEVEALWAARKALEEKLAHQRYVHTLFTPVSGHAHHMLGAGPSRSALTWSRAIWRRT